MSNNPNEQQNPNFPHQQQQQEQQQQGIPIRFIQVPRGIHVNQQQVPMQAVPNHVYVSSRLRMFQQGPPPPPHYVNQPNIYMPPQPQEVPPSPYPHYVQSVMPSAPTYLMQQRPPQQQQRYSHSGTTYFEVYNPNGPPQVFIQPPPQQYTNAPPLPPPPQYMNAPPPQHPQEYANAPPLPPPPQYMNAPPPQHPQEYVNAPPPQHPQEYANAPPLPPPPQYMTAPPPQHPQEYVNAPPLPPPPQYMNAPPPQHPQEYVNAPPPQHPQEYANAPPLPPPPQYMNAPPPQYPQEYANAPPLPPPPQYMTAPPPQHPQEYVNAPPLPPPPQYMNAPPPQHPQEYVNAPPPQYPQEYANAPPQYMTAPPQQHANAPPPVYVPQQPQCMHGPPQRKVYQQQPPRGPPRFQPRTDNFQQRGHRSQSPIRPNMANVRYPVNASKSDSRLLSRNEDTQNGFSDHVKVNCKEKFSNNLELCVYEKLDAKPNLILRERKGELDFKDSCTIYVNHFAIKIPDIIFEIYTFKIEVSVTKEGQEVKTKSIQDARVKRKLLKLLMDRYDSTKEGGGQQPIYMFDGYQSLFVQSGVDFDKLNGAEIVDVENNAVTFHYKFERTNSVVSFADLKRFIAEGKRNDTSMLSTFNVIKHVARETLQLKYQLFSRLFCDPGKTPINLNDGYYIFKGFTLDTQPSGDMMALVVNTTGCILPKEQPLLEFIREHFGKNDADSVRKNAYKVNQFIAGLKVSLTHLKFKKSIVITRLEERSANQLTFDIENGNKISVSEYFTQRYKKLELPDFPLIVEEKLDKNKVKRVCHYPIEFCQVIQSKGNVKVGPMHTKEIIMHTKEKPSVKYERINESMHGIEGEKFKQMDFDISKEMKSITGHLIPLPSLRYYGTAISLDEVRKGSWRVDAKFFKPAAVKNHLAVISFIDERHNRCISEFFQILSITSRNRGMDWPTANFPNIYNNDYDEVVDVLNTLKNSGKVYDFVFFLLRSKDDFHDLFKTLAEIVYGFRAICILEKSVLDKKGEVMNNLCMKMNERLDGVNQTLTIDENVKNIFDKDDPTMFVSADIAHPGVTQKGYPSLAAVLGSIDDYGKKYVCRMRAQWHPRSWTKSKEEQKKEVDVNGPLKQEIIFDLGSIILDLLETHVRKNGKIPIRIIYYRDAVSEGQVDNVTRVEVSMIKDGIAKFSSKQKTPLKKEIKLTYITVQKNHGTRFFLAKTTLDQNRNNTLRIENAKPGTVVADGICHPKESESYLLSHFMDSENSGTAKPSHYKCAYDESDFSEKELNSLHFYLSHLYARCNRSVRVPAPVYYAGLATVRGNAYLKVSTDENWRRNAMNRYKEKQQENGELQYFNIPLHENIKDELFFI